MQDRVLVLNYVDATSRGASTGASAAAPVAVDSMGAAGTTGSTGALGAGSLSTGVTPGLTRALLSGFSKVHSSVNIFVVFVALYGKASRASEHERPPFHLRKFSAGNPETTRVLFASGL